MKVVRSALLFSLLLGASSSWAQAISQVEVFKNPNCGCCEKWVTHLQENGFKVKVHNVSDVSAVRRAAGLDDRFASCHTGRIGKYVVEGHVPASDIRRLLVERPKALGLAVPSMPPGSPGMESTRPIPYETLLVQADGSHRTFAKH